MQNPRILINDNIVTNLYVKFDDDRLWKWKSISKSKTGNNNRKKKYNNNNNNVGGHWGRVYVIA